MEIRAVPAIKWVKLNRFCQLTGITEMAVRKKRHEGKWNEQIVKCAKDGMLYVNIEEYQKWIEQS
ncbi:MAG: hypothetical protein QG673_1222 [Pseudomonadota bacterium]|nr:hypothetical protein [Pseudomonadota bacterium]